MSEHAMAVPLQDWEPIGDRSEKPGGAPGHVVFVGVGLGGPVNITLAGVKAIAEADVVVVNDDVDPALLDEPELVLAPHSIRLVAGPQADLANLIADAKAGSVIAWLVAGDPLVDGVAAPLMQALASAGCGVDVVPGLARAGLAATTAGITLGQVSRLVLPGVDQPLTIAEQNIIALVHTEQLGEVSDAVQQSGFGTDEPVLVTINYASSQQRSIETDLGHLAAAAGDDHGPAAVIIGAAARRDAALNWYESKPLFGWRILVPRTKGLSGAMERRIEQHGALPVQVPTISVEPPRNPQPMERAIQGLVDGRFQWIIFNSANSVRAVTERLSDLGLDARAFSGLQIAAIGVQAVQALRDWGIVPDLVPEGAQRGESLAAEFPAFDELLDPINRILIPRADIAIDALVASLHELGWEVDDVIAYRTVRAAPPPAEIREGIKAGRFDAVVFSSASTVRNMVGIAGKPHADTIVAAIGPATVAACEQHGLRVDVVSDCPDVVDMVDALAAFAEDRRARLQTAGEHVRRPSQRRTRRRTR